MPEQKTYTQAEVDKMKQETADASFKAGQEKASASKKAAAEKAETKAKLDELETLRTEKAAREAKELFSKKVEAIKGLENTGLRKSAVSRFVKDNMEDLKDLEGDKLQAAIKAKFDKADEDTKDLMFETEFVKASGALTPEDKDKDKETEEYYPGTTIKRRK